MQLRKIPLHQSLIRPILLAGAERNLAMLNGVIAAALVFGGGSLWAVGLGILFAVVVHALLVRLAKRDHLLRVAEISIREAAPIVMDAGLQ